MLAGVPIETEFKYARQRGVTREERAETLPFVALPLPVFQRLMPALVVQHGGWAGFHLQGPHHLALK